MWKQNDKIEMLKVECLNNSLWNHLDKTIVASIVQRPESDRMRQKRRKTTRAPLAGLKGGGKWRGSLFVCFPLFLEGLPLQQSTLLWPLAKRGCRLDNRLAGTKLGRNWYKCPARIFPIKSCLRVTWTCHPWLPPCWRIKTFQLWSIWKRERHFRKAMHIVSFPNTLSGHFGTLQLSVHFLLYPWSTLIWRMEESQEVRETDGV